MTILEKRHIQKLLKVLFDTSMISSTSLARLLKPLATLLHKHYLSTPQPRNIEVAQGVGVVEGRLQVLAVISSMRSMRSL